MIIRSRKYLDGAKGQSCVHCHKKDGTIVAAHYAGLRQHAFGKGRGIKCHDLLVADLCSTCHELFDSGRAGPMHHSDDLLRRIDNSETFLYCVALTMVRRYRQGLLLTSEN